MLFARSEKQCTQLSEIELSPAEDCINLDFAPRLEFAQKSKTKLPETGHDQSQIQERLIMVERAKSLLIEFPVEAAMSVLQSNAQLLLV